MNIFVTLPQGKIFDSFIPPEVKEKLECLGNVQYNNLGRQFTQNELKENISDKDVVITGWGTPLFDKSVLEKNDRLKIIAHMGGSVQCIVDATAYDKGITVISGNDIYAESVAEAVIAYALAALRKIPDYCTLTKNGGWNGIDIWEGLLDQTIGLVGYGMTVKHLIKMLAPFRPRILVYSNHISDEELRKNGLIRASLEEIFSTSKIISLHSALNQRNYHMVNKNLLELIQTGAILINTARGGIIDEAALAEELGKGRFRAVLDVFEEEPLPEDSLLRKMENAYIIPHRAGPTYDRRKFVTLGLMADIENFFAGRPLALEITREYAGYMTKE